VIRALVQSSRLHLRDIGVGAALALVAAFSSFAATARLDPVLLHPATEDVWFQSDIPRVYESMTRRDGDYYRSSSVHPLFALATLPPVSALWKGLGLEAITAVRIVLAIVAALWVVAFLVILRLAGLPKLDATLFTLVAIVSAAAVFWFSVPETYPFGSLSILFALAVVAAGQRVALKERWYVVASIASFGFTVTNWMVGIAASFVSLRWKRAVTMTVNAFLIATFLWLVQRHFVPGADSFLNPYLEKKYLLTADAGGPAVVLRSFFFHGVVMPAIETIERINPPGWPIMSVQHSSVWGGGTLAFIASTAWLALLLLGAWAFAVARENLNLRMVIGAVLIGQLVLHLLYGEETFLYSLHFAPLLVLVGAFATTTCMRPIALALAVVLIGCGGANNIMRLFEATAFFQSGSVSARADVLREKMARSDDPWPRGTGHVVLARPGSPEHQKSYHEPGGSFSPVPGSFGVSFWVRGRDHHLRTSDDVPQFQIRQHLDTAIAANREGPAAINTETPMYRTRWSLAGQDAWNLTLERDHPSDSELSLVIRSVGPAGGPIQMLEWDGQRLRINDRWTVTVAPAPAAVTLGDERDADWKTAKASARQWSGKHGWGYARLDLGGERRWQARIADSARVTDGRLRVAVARSALELSLPDPEFSQSVHAQVAHLLMSLVGNQTRSADPINTPVAWQRTGTYIVAALARAGETATARKLSRYLAENDFYGGFGAEADAPGLAIWALRQVAGSLNEGDYDAWLWPHVRRKAGLITTMLSTKEPIRRKPPTPIVPRFARHPDNELVAEPARDGLIVGRMDYQRPILYINAVSYRGLLDAAWFADRLGEKEQATIWRSTARQLRSNWEKGFRTPKSRNVRTYSSVLWPTWIGSSMRNEVRSSMLQRWDSRRDSLGGYREVPLWTYFELAEAHQWLFLNDIKRSWATLRWFWGHQASPGLYTWWEDRTEGNSYHGWNRVRGWVEPPHVTPHYWTSAEMLLLQLDMLAYVDESGLDLELVIGAGVLPEWTKQPMKVHGLSTSFGNVSWTWHEGQMDVVVHRNSTRKFKIRLGEAFPPQTPLHVEFR